MEDTWVVDAGMSRDGMWCLIPVEGLGTDKQRFVVGLNLLVGQGSFDGRNVVGVIHEEGQDAVDSWCDENRDLLEKASHG